MKIEKTKLIMYVFVLLVYMSNIVSANVPSMVGMSSEGKLMIEEGKTWVNERYASEKKSWIDTIDKYYNKINTRPKVYLYCFIFGIAGAQLILFALINYIRFKKESYILISIDNKLDKIIKEKGKK